MEVLIEARSVATVDGHHLSADWHLLSHSVPCAQIMNAGSQVAKGIDWLPCPALGCVALSKKRNLSESQTSHL